MLSLEPSRSRQFDLEGQLEASHAEVAHMREQIAAATAAVASARGSPIAKKHYPAPGDADYSEDSLIRCRERARNLQRFCPCVALGHNHECAAVEHFDQLLASFCCEVSSLQGCQP